MNKLNFTVNIPTFDGKKYNIVDFGAKAEINYKNTEAINNAIKKCSTDGGGMVIVPNGLWLTGPILMQSNVDLHLENNAIILFSSDINDYPLISTNFEGFFTYRCMSPIYGKDLTNVAITGKGVLNGNGGPWRPAKKFKLTDNQWNEHVASGGVVLEGYETTWWPSQEALDGHKTLVPNPELLRDKETCEKYKAFLRPVMVNFSYCKNVLLDGPTFRNSPAWCLHPWACEHVTIRNVIVQNPWFAQNGDGLDVDSCKYVQVLDSTFDVGDDALCVKSGKNEDGRRLGKPCEYVLFKNCVVYHGHGGFVIGSEMSGGVKNIEVTNCTFIGTETGIRFKSCLGRGGIVEDIYINDINMINIPHEAILFATNYDMDTKDGQDVSPEEIPEFKNIYIDGINCINAGSPISICGLTQMPVHDIYLKNINITTNKDSKIQLAENIIQENINLLR